MLNITTKICYAWAAGATAGLPDAEVVAIGNLVNEKNRLKSIKKKYSNTADHDNIPLPGFTLYKSSRKNSGSADTTWQVIDPRGYLSRITNSNLEEILHCTGVTEGLIQEKCIWARDGNQTTLKLVPISSNLYINAVGNTKLLNEKVSIRDVQIGDKVLLENGLFGTYMGTLSLYTALYGKDTVHTASALTKRQIIRLSDKVYYYQVDTKILKVLDTADVPMSLEESARIINDSIASGNTYFSSASNLDKKYYSNKNIVRYVSTQVVKSIKISLEEISRTEAEALFNYILQDVDVTSMLMENAAGKLSSIRDFRYASSVTTIDRFMVDPVDRISENSITVKRSLLGRIAPIEHQGLDNFVKFYKIVKHVKDKTYV